MYEDASGAIQFVLIAGSNRVVYVLNRGEIRLVEGVWASHTLNRKAPADDATLQRVVTLYHAPEGGSVLVEASTDGGETFPDERSLTLPAADRGVIATWFDVTGRDLRVRWTIPASETRLVILTHYIITLTERGPYALRSG